MAVSLAQRTQANYFEFFRAMARLSPDGLIEESDGLLLARSGPQLPFNNFAAPTSAPRDPAALLERARCFFATSGVTWMLSTTDETVALSHVARAAGMQPGQEPGMLLAPIAGIPPVAPGLSIEVVSNVTTLRVYNDTMTSGFGSGPWAQHELLDSRALIDAIGITNYLGRVDGEPVATALLFSCHRIAGLFNISTAPAYRGRGFGAAMTWRAAADGAADGCLGAYLQASEMGAPVYARLGFLPVRTYRTWLLPAGRQP